MVETIVPFITTLTGDPEAASLGEWELPKRGSGAGAFRQPRDTLPGGWDPRGGQRGPGDQRTATT